MANPGEAAARPESRFLRACRREATDVTPIWLMRQAGRYLPEYRRLREHHPLLDMIKTPELACEVTLQPIRAFDLDAAIIFADILPPLEGMGLHLRFAEGEGPIIGNPVRTVEDIAHLRVLPPEETLPFTLDAIRLAREQLDGRNIPLIGFSGAPFTLAAYAIEGSGSRNYTEVKGLMMSDPAAWHDLMSKLSEVVGAYLLAQAQAGAQVLQLFDSWVGQLAPADYRQFVLPHTQHAIAIARAANVPIIHFATDTSGYLEAMRETGADVISVDWRVDLDAAWQRLGAGVAIQGNLDPVALLAPWDALKQRAQMVLEQVGGRAGHIFNLGHGILPSTPPDNVKRLVDFVHEYSAATHV
ncbi:MAG TPA: uroporphyrinogen decarboxylase [Ktedonobacterales bacterium]|nr:uroporphyrinogen decarboxylase [Ktedonobacterales bacterium]